jgi:replicative DNA helicase
MKREIPQCSEAEEGVLACVMISPRECLSACLERFGHEQMFYDLRRQEIFNACVTLDKKQIAVDLITLHEELKDRLEQVGGTQYLCGLPDKTPSSANLDYYLDILCEKHILRKTLYACDDLIKRVYAHDGDPSEMLDAAERTILELRPRGKKTASILDIVRKVLNRAQTAAENKGSLSGLSTGIPELDRFTGGLQDGEMTVLAGYPSSGKTSLALNIAELIGVDGGLPVGFFTLEMNSEQIVTRLICSRSCVNMQNLRRGMMQDEEVSAFFHVSGEIGKAKLFFDDTSNLKAMELRARARRMWQNHGLRLLVVDYLQLLEPEARRGDETRQEQVATMSRMIKQLAAELQVPAIVLSQLNEKGNLKESGAIGADADGVWILKPPGKENDDGKTPITLHIKKQRNGPADENVDLLFEKRFTRFTGAL